MFSVWCLNIYVHFRQSNQQPLTAETQVQSWVNSQDICGGQIGIGTGLFLSSSVFLFQYQPLFVTDSEDTFTQHANDTVYPDLNVLYHKKHYNIQRSIQNCSQYVKGNTSFLFIIYQLPLMCPHYYLPLFLQTN